MKNHLIQNDNNVQLLSQNESNPNTTEEILLFDQNKPNKQNNASYDCNFGCHFDKKDTKDIESKQKARRKLLFAVIFCFLFMIGEFLGGYFGNSVALMSDALHLLSDCGGIMISVFALWMTQKEATDKLSYGYHRAEIVGALFSVFIIWGLTVWLVYEAIDRLITPQDVDGEIMFIVACAGIAVNIAMMNILHEGHGHSHGGHGHSHGGHSHGGHDHGKHEKHDESHSHSHDDHEHSNHSHSDDNKDKKGQKKEDTRNINQRSAFIHVLGDLLQSIGVCVAAALIWYDDAMFRWTDPVCTLIFSVIVMFTTVNLLKDTLGVLMESVPAHIDFKGIARDLQALDDVCGVHDLHVWNLSVGKPSLSVHLLVQSSTMDDDGKVIPACVDGVLRKAQKLCRVKYKIDHSTIQIEWPHQARDDEDSGRSCPSYCSDKKANAEMSSHSNHIHEPHSDHGHSHDHHDHDHSHNHDHDHDHSHD